jgi:hypothetical protein
LLTVQKVAKGMKRPKIESPCAQVEVEGWHRLFITNGKTAGGATQAQEDLGALESFHSSEKCEPWREPGRAIA